MSRRKGKRNPLIDSDAATIRLLCDEASNHMKVRNYTKALTTYNQALELNANDQNALVARSKCYLLLGEPAKALQDSETALLADKNHIRAIYQKAESLYFLGQFEHSLMFFHRGLRLRPELASFRLGIQKTQEAIQNTIGAAPKPQKKSSNKIEMEKHLSSNVVRAGTDLKVNLKPRAKSSKVDAEKKQSRRLLGELYVDLEYLENLLKHPDLKRADSDSEHISLHAKEAVTYLNTRQEFWRQQRPPTSIIGNQKKGVNRVKLNT